MNRELKLKKYIDSLDFAIYETVLFLDTHPCDTKALTLLEKYKTQDRKQYANTKNRDANTALPQRRHPRKDVGAGLTAPGPGNVKEDMNNVAI